jgi:serine/threonine protein kinase
MELKPRDSLVSWRDIIYATIDRIGGGGSARVYRILATNGVYQGVEFAVKIFNATDKETWRLNFMREVHFLRYCTHPSIMRVFDEGVYQDKYPFVVMEHYPETLYSAMRSRTLGDVEKIRCVIQLLSALKYLALRDPPVVHRDIKPKNIMLKSGSFVLGDFGLLLPIDDYIAAAQSKGKRPKVPEMAIEYRTPELVAQYTDGTRPPPASDVFQFGLVIAELFTGKNPLPPGSPKKPVELDPLGEVAGPLSERVKFLIGRMLTTETQLRPRADEILRQWQDLLLERLDTSTTTRIPR